MAVWRKRRGGARLEEIETVYRERLGELRRVAAAVTGDRESAADVVQDAFVSAVRRRDAFRADGPIEAWVWWIVVNEARSARRRNARAARSPEVPAPSTNGAGDRVQAAVLALPERQRLILFLRYYADLDYATIAAVAGVSPGTVAATLNAAHRALRRLLEEAPR